jgi:hypothetical protein
MSPTTIDPNIDYRRLHELSEGFAAVWSRLHALHLDAVAGYEFVRPDVDLRRTCCSCHSAGNRSAIGRFNADTTNIGRLQGMATSRLKETLSIHDTILVLLKSVSKGRIAKLRVDCSA